MRNQSILAPYWADINTNTFGEVYYREVIDLKSLTRISCDISRSYLTFTDYKPSWGFIITWHDVGAHGYSSGQSEMSAKNTFQLILSTDGLILF